jgi:hypothetical protein
MTLAAVSFVRSGTWAGPSTSITMPAQREEPQSRIAQQSNRSRGSCELGQTVGGRLSPREL